MLYLAGFYHEKKRCEASGNIELKRLWRVDCEPLVDYPEKNLFLRSSHNDFLIGTKAQYECSAGCGQMNPVDLTLECLFNGKWSKDPAIFPECFAIECSSLPLPNDTSLGGSLSYSMFFRSDISLAGTSFRYECPKAKYFINRISHFKAECGFDGLDFLAITFTKHM